jgi:hypothetical protein
LALMASLWMRQRISEHALVGLVRDGVVSKAPESIRAGGRSVAPDH